MFSHLQSTQDVPTRVTGGTLGRSRIPALHLSKWGDEAYLRIEHHEERVREEVTQKGQTTLLTGERRHVFRRLDEERFEYDIILESRPPHPVVILPLEFPRGLSFYKQKATGRDDLVSGSIAVYWKKRNNVYRTGKLCHIYRPKIIDTGGRWIWGELDFDGENLVISIDEAWLKTARYPVTVDPIVGTSSVGAKHQDESDPNPENWTDLLYEMVMPVNRYLAPSSIYGSCTASIYAYKSDSDAQGFPVLYAESGSDPAAKLSSSESLIDMRSPSGGGEWITGSFQVNPAIPPGIPIWFGVMPLYMLYPYFDDGGDTREMDTYVHDTPPASFTPAGWSVTPRTLSMYFSYVEQVNHSLSLSSAVDVDEGVVRRHGLSNPLADGMSPLDGVMRVSEWRRPVEDSVSLSDEAVHRAEWARGIADDGGVEDGLIRRVGRFLRLSDAPVLWDWIRGRRMLGKIVVNLLSRIVRVLNLKSRME